MFGADEDVVQGGGLVVGEGEELWGGGEDGGDGGGLIRVERGLIGVQRGLIGVMLEDLAELAELLLLGGGHSKEGERKRWIIRLIRMLRNNEPMGII